MHSIVKYMPWNEASWYWLVWFIGGFGIREAIALIQRRSQDTLSYQIWHLGDVDVGKSWTFLHYCIAAFGLWMFLHFTWRLFR